MPSGDDCVGSRPIPLSRFTIASQSCRPFFAGQLRAGRSPATLLRKTADFSGTCAGLSHMPHGGRSTCRMGQHTRDTQTAVPIQRRGSHYTPPRDHSRGGLRKPESHGSETDGSRRISAEWVSEAGETRRWPWRSCALGPARIEAGAGTSGARPACERNAAGESNPRDRPSDAGIGNIAYRDSRFERRGPWRRSQRDDGRDKARPARRDAGRSPGRRGDNPSRRDGNRGRRTAGLVRSLAGEEEVPAGMGTR